MILFQVFLGVLLPKSQCLTSCHDGLLTGVLVGSLSLLVCEPLHRSETAVGIPQNKEERWNLRRLFPPHLWRHWPHSVKSEPVGLYHVQWEGTKLHLLAEVISSSFCTHFKATPSKCTELPRGSFMGLFGVDFEVAVWVVGILPLWATGTVRFWSYIFSGVFSEFTISLTPLLSLRKKSNRWSQDTTSYSDRVGASWVKVIARWEKNIQGCKHSTMSCSPQIQKHTNSAQPIYPHYYIC